MELLAALAETSKRVPIVLAKNVNVDEKSGAFVVESDIFDGRLTSRLVAGYVLLPHDVRQIATIIKDDRHRNLDSFAVAVARMTDPNSVIRIDQEGAESLPFAWFLTREGFRNRWVTSSALRQQPIGSFRALRGSAVIIGGTWSQRGYGRGDAVDLHSTPVGEIPGAALLANYVETLLNESATPSLGHFGTRVIELVFGIVLACVFVCALGRWKGLFVGMMLVIATFISILFFQNVGVFVDAVPLVAALLAHTLYEQILDWKAEADEHRTHCMAQRDEDHAQPAATPVTLNGTESAPV
jgi:hypothetical protein